MKIKLLISFFALSFFCSNSHAMGAKRPEKSPSEPSSSASNSSIEPTLDFGPRLLPDDYLNTSIQIGKEVDDHKNDDELIGARREIINNDQVDQCFSDTNAHEYFSDQISYYTSEMLTDIPAKVAFIGSSYGTSTNDNNYFPTSLIRHPLCMSSSASLKATMKNNVPSSLVIEKINRFSSDVNALRLQVLEGDQSAKLELQAHWSRLFSCLSYSESLSTADMASSINVAKKVAPTGYRKPAGVKFYEDKDQPQVSRLNIGMFQFTPDSTGNVQPCIRAWNALHAQKPVCQINQRASQAELIKILGSSLQSFNAFCGVHKLIQTFAIQVNTSKTSATHPSNKINGKLKPYEERCVTPHFYRGWAYNHFGPLQNSTGKNLGELFSCIESSR